MSRKNLQKSIDTASGMLNSNCTITEAVQIARGVVDDAILDYHRNQNNVQLAMSIQLEIIKKLLFSSGMITEEEFRQQYMEEVQKMQEQQKKMMAQDNPQATTSMKVEAGDVEVRVEE